MRLDPHPHHPPPVRITPQAWSTCYVPLRLLKAGASVWCPSPPFLPNLPPPPDTHTKTTHTLHISLAKPRRQQARALRAFEATTELYPSPHSSNPLPSPPPPTHNPRTMSRWPGPGHSGPGLWGPLWSHRWGSWCNATHPARATVWGSGHERCCWWRHCVRNGHLCHAAHAHKSHEWPAWKEEQLL